MTILEDNSNTMKKKYIIIENRTLNSSAGSEIKLNLHLQKQCSVLQCIANDGKTKQTWKIVLKVFFIPGAWC